MDSGFRQNDGAASLVIPGKAVGRDPESRIVLCHHGTLLVCACPKLMVGFDTEDLV